jgi:uncharacterized protein YndB with AHSA1/START domain
MNPDQTIAREIVINAPPEVVWQTITEPDRISQWFADRVDVEIRVGEAGDLVFDNELSGGESVVSIVVDVLERPQRFAFRWGHGVGVSTLVEFTLEAEGPERTLLRVVETGLDATGWTDEVASQYAEDHLEGWEFHLQRLANVLQ